MSQPEPRASSDKALRRKQVEFLARAEGFFESRILFALNKLDVFNVLGEDTHSVDAPH